MESAPVESELALAAAPARRSGPTLTDGLLVCLALIWGMNFVVVKAGTTVMAPLAFNGTRIPLAAVTLGIITRAMGRAWPPRRDALMLLLLGALGNGVYQIFFIEGVARTRAGDAALVVAATPALTALIGRMRGVDHIPWRGALGIGVSLSGVALVVLGSARTLAGAQGLRGDLIVLCGSVCWATYSVLVKPYTHRASLLAVSALAMAGGSCTLLLVSTPDLVATHWSALPMMAWGSLAYGGFMALVVGQIFWSRGVRMLGPTRTALYSNLQPLVALLFAWVALSETPTAWQWTGGAAIISGLLLTRS